jgi:hypothetical protein
LFVRVDELTCRVSKGLPNACNLLYAGCSKCCKGVRLCNSYVTGLPPKMGLMEEVPPDSHVMGAIGWLGFVGGY